MQNFEIRTEQLFLRTIEKSDVPEIFRVARKNPDLPKFMSWNPPEQIKETLTFFESTQKDFPEKSVVWSIFFEEKFVGIVSLEKIERKYGVLQTGYWLDPEFHGNGIMPEAARAVLSFGFENLDLHKIIAHHFSENIPSKKVIEKLGFRFVGTLEKDFGKNGRWHDAKLYELLKKNFKK